MTIFLCTDLDRTLVPNGHHPESPEARSRFAALTDRSEIVLAYVSGRSQQQIHDAITEYDLPIPDYVVSDVGSNIFEAKTPHIERWQNFPDWHDELESSWSGETADAVTIALEGISGLKLQQDGSQGSHKVSFYTTKNHTYIVEEVQERLDKYELGHAKLVDSFYEPEQIGLLDILPINAGKLGAINFLIKHLKIDVSATIFAGDSGNDLDVLASNIRSVAVANSTAELKAQATTLASKNGTLNSLYIATGGLEGLNGNYSAGILEGLAHFVPITKHWF